MDHLPKLGIHTNNLPVSLTSLIGRGQEVKAIHALLLRPEVRLLTLTGTAGVGKTRLALQVARELVHDFADGVHVVSLAPISDPAFVIATIAHSIGLTESGSQPVLELLKISQRDKLRLLLLDNFEHVITAAPLLAELLEACSQLKLLVTSREVLRLRGEHQFVLLPLALPDLKHLPDDSSLAHVPAVHLFLQRAQAIRSDFQVTKDNATTIAEICHRLDGLPLAIELAAARVKVLSLQALLTRLEHRLQLLTGSARELLDRQQTLRNTLQWSYDLLSEEEQRLFRRLAVFVGGCTLEAVEALDRALGSGVTSVLDGVTSLIDKSLLRQTELEEPRLVMLEIIREYGLEALAAHGEIESTQQAHANYFLRFSEEAEPELPGQQQVMWLERLEQEHDNLRAALRWLLEQGETNQSRKEMALRLAGELWQFWEVRCHYSEGRAFLIARVEARQGDNVAARALYEEGLALAKEIGNKSNIASYLEGLAQVVSLQGEELWAARLWGAANALREAIHTPLPPIDRADYERSVAAVRGSLGEKAFTAAWSQGRVMSPEQALVAQEREMIMRLPADQPPTSPMKSSPTYPNGLTAREVEVLRLLAKGLTSVQIAEQLVIGVVTVNFHVRSFYSKLGVTSRSAATRYALDHHLV